MSEVDANRTALVTGATSGLGAAAVERLRADGVRVLTADVVGEVDYLLDVSDTAAVQAAAGEMGPVDILVNSAGIIGPHKPLLESDGSEWRHTLEVNLLGTFNTIRSLGPGMVERQWGRIVNIASLVGKDGNPNLAAYSASKAAVIGLTKSVGRELATTGVLVNAIAPGVIATPMIDAMAEPGSLGQITNIVPMRRVGQPEEVAELIAYLGSHRVSFSTGAVYDISGGLATY